MGTLIDGILEYAQSGRTEIRSEPVDTSAVLATTLENLKFVVEQTCAQLTHDPLPVVYGCEILILQVFQNLVANALKFHGTGPSRIHIGTTPEGDFQLFTVQDNGLGIRAESLKTVFEPFRRLNSSDDYSGSGLGPAICKQNVERHGGRIWLTSAPGEGSTVHFTLPAHARVLK